MKRIPESLPEHAFPLQNYDLERTDLFFRKGHGANRVRILAGLRDPGETNSITPILKQLTGTSSDVLILADSRGKELLVNNDLGFKAVEQYDPLLTIASLKADAAITGFSTDPGTAFAITANARLADTPTIWFEDYPGGMVPHYTDVKERNPKLLLPDYIFVCNDWAKGVTLEALQNFNPSKVIVTGQPSLDSIASENRQEIQTEVKKRLAIDPNDKLIVYMGIPTIASAEALEVLVKGINDLGLRNYRLVNRRHPRDTSSQDLYNQIISSVEPNMVDTSEFPTTAIGIAADLIITTYSSEGLVAIYRGIPSIHILIQNILEKSESKGDIPIPPPVLDGSSLAVYEVREMAEALEQALLEPQSMTEKMAHWKVDGHATERAVKQLLSIAYNHKLLNNNQ